jgi:tRNA A37 threonylcarbamoyladenosine dehydratase
MQDNWLMRTEMLLGEENLSILSSKRVMVAGLGGVGSYAAEMIARAGVGHLTLVDGDTVNLTNINRQLIALHSTLGMNKAQVMKQRLLDINPLLNIEIVDGYIKDKLLTDTLDKGFDYVLDAIDTLSPKVYLIVHSLNRGLKIVSSLGAGGKLNPSLIQIVPMNETYNCKFAQAVRKKLNHLKIKTDFPVVFSPEPVDMSKIVRRENQLKQKSMVGTISYIPATFGMFAASVVIRDLLGEFKF